MSYHNNNMNQQTVGGFFHVPQQQQQQQQQTQQQQYFLEHAHVLEGNCELLSLPEITPIDRDTPVDCPCLYLGHVRFECTPAQLRWLIQETANVSALKVEPRGKGGFAVFLKSDEDVSFVRQLHKRILFDHSGVWFARTNDQAQMLAEYAAGLQYIKRTRYRLPRDAMTVEDAKTRPQQFRGGNNTNTNMMMMPQQQQQQQQQSLDSGAAQMMMYQFMQQQQQQYPSAIPFSEFATMGQVIPQQQQQQQAQQPQPAPQQQEKEDNTDSSNNYQHYYTNSPYAPNVMMQQQQQPQVAPQQQQQQFLDSSASIPQQQQQAAPKKKMPSLLKQLFA